VKDAAPFVHDPKDWLRKMSPTEWVTAAMSEVRRAERAYEDRQAKAGLASARRAAGMALNAVLIVEPHEGWGRSFVDHLRALVDDEAAPPEVRASCTLLLDTQPPGPGVISLRSSSRDKKVVDAAKDVIAHAYARIVRAGAVE
jgi:HEPN domain-containing protein